MLDKKRKFIFSCEDCGTILSAEFEEKEEIDKVNNNKVALECPCGGFCTILRD